MSSPTDPEATTLRWSAPDGAAAGFFVGSERKIAVSCRPLASGSGTRIEVDDAEIRVRTTFDR